MPDGNTTAADAPALQISAGAATRLKAMIENEGNPALKFRITVSGGGCSGFQYGFDFDETVNDDDLVFGRDGVEVVVDEVSMQFLGGAELDFKQELIGSYFALENPNASSTCGCGTSFAV